MEGQADDMVDQYADQGLQLLIVMQETANFNEAPTQADCQTLQATQKAHILFVPDRALTEVLEMRVNTGAALIDENGLWLTTPVGEESFGEAYGALFSLFRTGGGF